MSLVVKILKQTGIVLFVLFGIVNFAQASIVLESDLNKNGISDSSEMDVVMQENAVLPAGEYNFNNLTITNNATLTLDGDPNSPDDFKGVKINANNLNVTSGAHISTDSQGYIVGPGSPLPNDYGVGASYGGRGGGDLSPLIYGSATRPIELGSGMGGNRGGGAIRLIILNMLQNNGSISADGLSEHTSGGSLYITTNNLSGDGVFRANGGNSSWPQGTIAGGGGRIAIYYQNYSFSGTALAQAGVYCFYGCNPAAENGTVGFFDTLHNTLNIYTSWRFQKNDSPFDFNNVNFKNSAKVTAENDINITADNLLIDQTSLFVLPGNQVLNIFNITINGTSILTLSGGETINVKNILVKGNSSITIPPEKILYLNVQNLTVEPGSSISADGKGYVVGPGTPDTSAYYTTGASYGGMGGGAAAKPTYGSGTAPVDFGSGTENNRGGGAIRLIVNNSLHNDGIISANYPLYRSDRTSGGSVYVTAGELSGNGVFQANGGNSVWPYGPTAGGGGRIAIYYQNSSFSGTATAKGGVYCFYGCSPAAEDGTVVMNASSPVCTENCFSNVLFLPGIKGSVLKSSTDTLWPPTIFSVNDISQLALTNNGESLNSIYTDGVLNTFWGTNIYAPFLNFMDNLVVDKTINEWLPLAYDWRFSPDSIIENGIKTSAGIIDIMERIEKLAADSKTDKITIVAHSMGGLLGKAIIKKLQDEGKDNLVESFIMVGSPQLGTPQAVASILHGDSENIAFGFITNPINIRKIAQNMPSAYNLLPSRKYFELVQDPVINFSVNALFTEIWRNLWGSFTNNYSSFFSFLTGENASREKPAENNLLKPEVLKADLLAAARDLHDLYDNYQFPEHIRVVEVAGWGLPTVKSVDYIMRHGIQSYKTNFTVEGDKTVVYPSAVSLIADDVLYFNLATHNAQEDTPDFQHRNILNSGPIKDLIKTIIKKSQISENLFVRKLKPDPGLLFDKLIVSTHSPVILGAYDQFGNFTGIDPSQDLSQEILSIKEDIPNSMFIYNNDGQYIFLPKEGIYDFVYKGIVEGLTTVEIEELIGDTTTLIISYTDIPTTGSTTAGLELSGIDPNKTILKIDQNGDGEIDENIYHDEYVFSLEELIVILKDKIQKLDTKEKIKKDLLKRVDKLEKKIEKNKEKFENKKILKTLSNMTLNIMKKSTKDKIDDKQAQELIDLINKIENVL